MYIKVVEIDHHAPICSCIRLPISVPQIAGIMVHYSLMFQCIFPLYKGKLPDNHSITTKTEMLIVININI